jgi:hypothetical protein
MAELTEVEALRAEVAVLRAQPVPVLPAGQPCTCGTTPGYWAHPRPWPGNVWISAPNACAGGFAGQVYTVNTTTPLKIENQSYNTGCAAAGVPQTFTFT